MTGATLIDRRRAELLAKLDSLEAEFKVWRDASEEGQPLRKHNSQIRRMATALEGLVGEIQAGIKPGAQILGDGPGVERQMLELHRMWDYFRAKLLLRQSPAFERFLYATDELAWACYEPVQRQTARLRPHTLKEPPLTFFNGAWSPYAAGRGRAYSPEQVEGALLKMTSVHDAIRRLPIPVVGVPWYLATHLPDSPVICHEVGHLVEQDFELTEALDAALATAKLSDERHRPAWQAWRSEVFADVYGCLGAGPAFVSALMGFLTDTPTKVAEQERRHPGWEKYPTSALRVAFDFAVLRRLDLGESADVLQDRWDAFYGADKMEAFLQDVDAIAGALLTTPLAPLGDVAIRDVLPFLPSDQKSAEEQAAGLLLTMTPKPVHARRIHAAARIAFDTDPVKYAEAKVGERVLKALWDARDKKVRRAAPALAIEDLAAADRSLGASLFAELQAMEEEEVVKR